MVGFGYDVHKLAEGESLILGGIKIDSPIGTVAHSDGDVLIHAVIDAILGAAGLGDIGEHFPDTDDKWKGADSTKLLKAVMGMIREEGLHLINVDAIIVMEKPKLSPHKEKIKLKLAELLHLPPKKVNIKATTSEKMGFIGRGEGVAVHAVCMLENK